MTAAPTSTTAPRPVDLLLGTAQLDAEYGVLGQSVRSAGVNPVEFLREAVNLGFGGIDTAPSYGDAETIIGQADISVPIHTKIGPGEDPARSLAQSLRRLRRPSVAVAYLHDPDAPLEPEASGIHELAQLVGGPLDHLGVSVYTHDAFAAALENELIDVIQLPVNPLLPSLIGTARRTRDKSTRLIARSVLAQGLLASNPNALPARLGDLMPAIREFQSACLELERSPQEVAILWARDHPLVEGLVLGAANQFQLVDLAGIFRQPPLSTDERLAIDRIDTPEPSALDPRHWG